MASVFTVGSLNVDLVAYVERLPGAGETVRGQRFERFPGGKGANQAVAAARAGAVSYMIGALGDDSYGNLLRQMLAQEQVDISGVETVVGPTGVALITVSGGDNRIVVVPGANDRIDLRRVEHLPLAPGDICVAQLETRIEIVQAAFHRARSCGALTLFNPAPAGREALALLPLADVIVVNESEAALLAETNFDGSAAEARARAAAQSLTVSDAQILVVTLGAEGVVASCDDQTIRVPGHRVPAFDTTGAGDCFCGYLAAALARGEGIAAALREANAAAALSVRTTGAMPSFPNRAQVTAYLADTA